MRKIIILAVSVVIFTSCTITIPLQANLSDQTMLLAENRNIKADYTIVSDIPDGYIPYIAVQKNGNETINNTSYKYGSKSAAKKIWSSYFSSKFNNFAEDEMKIEVTLEELKLREQAATSMGMTMLTGNSKVNVEALAKVHVYIKYNDKKYEKQFEVSASDYNESQRMQAGDYSYTANQTNPTQQKSKLLETCLNKSVIQFENFVSSILLSHKEGD